MLRYFYTKGRCKDEEKKGKKGFHFDRIDHSNWTIDCNRRNIRDEFDQDTR